jgi:hypothetical protein
MKPMNTVFILLLLAVSANCDKHIDEIYTVTDAMESKHKLFMDKLGKLLIEMDYATMEDFSKLNEKRIAYSDAQTSARMNIVIVVVGTIAIVGSVIAAVVLTHVIALGRLLISLTSLEKLVLDGKFDEILSIFLHCNEIRAELLGVVSVALARMPIAQRDDPRFSILKKKYLASIKQENTNFLIILSEILPEADWKYQLDLWKSLESIDVVNAKNDVRICNQAIYSGNKLLISYIFATRNPNAFYFEGNRVYSSVLGSMNYTITKHGLVKEIEAFKANCEFVFSQPSFDVDQKSALSNPMAYCSPFEYERTGLDSFLVALCQKYRLLKQQEKE